MASTTPPSLLRFDSYEVHVPLGELRRYGHRIKLQEKPFQILVFLLERPGELVTREELRQRLWPGNTFVDFDHNLNNAVNKLREVLNDSSEEPRFIETFPRRGYRFVMPKPCESASHASLTDSFSQADERANDPRLIDYSSSPAAKPLHETKQSQLATATVSGIQGWVLVGLISAMAGVILFAFPFLREKPVLSNTDLVLISDLTNTTGDGVFDNSLKQAISVELTQSPYLNVLSETKIAATLTLMAKSPDTKLSGEIAREVCLRAGAKAFIAPTIAALSNAYLVGLNAINCQTGESLARDQEKVSSKDGVLKALDNVSSRVRKELGESLSSVRDFDSPLERATTRSLEALKSYSLANNSRSDAESIPLFRRAVELDPLFALAYDGLGIAYSNINEPGLASQNITKAFELRDRTGEREKLRISADYYQVITGELEKANQTCELWIQIYPRDHYPHNLLGVNYEFLGKYENAASEISAAVRLNPDSSLLYSNLMEDYTALGRFEDAKVTYRQALDRGRDQVFLHADRYGIAFLENDTKEMAAQVAWSVGKHGAEDWLLSYESDTNAYFGRLQKAREYSRRAVQLALRGGEKETAALWQINAAIHEGEVGNFAEARKGVVGGLKIAPSSRDVRVIAALALARAGDGTGAEKLADSLSKEFPVNTVINFYWLPTIRAAVALNHGRPAKAVQFLEAAENYELGGPNPEIEDGRLLYPIYIRGQAYLMLHRGREAADEFQKMLSHPELLQNSPLGALARLGMARASLAESDSRRARIQYREFLELWKDGDRGIPVLNAAVSEYAKLD